MTYEKIVQELVSTLAIQYSKGIISITEVKKLAKKLLTMKTAH